MADKLILKDGRAITIREASVPDAEAILDFASLVFTTTDQVLTTPAEFNITVDEERGYIHTHAMTPTAILMVAAHDDKIVSLMNFNCNPRAKMKHTGEFGLSVHPAYRQQGIGRAMVKALIAWAQNIPEIEKIILHVLNTNTGAIKMYEELGFAHEGREVKVIKQPDGSYADLMAMGLFLER